MAETPNVMPSLHMPLQAGSDRVLKAMRRSYRSARFLGILDQVRAQIPDAAITTDLIVGFPGETDEDFEQTLEVVRASRFASAFTFQYSIRPGTPAATMDDQVPKAVVQERFERLIAVQEEVSWAGNRAVEGREVPRPGDMVTVQVTYGAPHHLVADSGLEGGTYAVRRMPGGDAWAALQDAPQGTGKPAVSLGMPSIGRPAVTPVASGCPVV